MSLNHITNRKRQTHNDNDKNNGTQEFPEQREDWFRKLYKWIITMHGDADVVMARGYRKIPGITNYVFFFGGRLRTIRNSKQLPLLIGGMIIAPMVLFSIFEAHKLWNTHYGHKALVFFFYYFWLMALSFFIRTATSDAGLLPRNVHLAQITNNYRIPQEYYNIIHLPTPKTQEEAEYHVEVKYCTVCRIWRPPRSSHCSTCNACIMVHDHHCIWVNNCIGKRNYRFFIIFLVSLILTAIFLIANCSIHIASNQNGASQEPVAILLLVYGAVFIWYPATLFMYHVAMTGTQQTTREFLKRVQSKNPVFAKITPNKHNPFDKGSFLANMGHLMLQPRGLSTLSPRETNHVGDWRFVRVPEATSFQKVPASTWPNPAWNSAPNSESVPQYKI